MSDIHPIVSRGRAAIIAAALAACSDDGGIGTNTDTEFGSTTAGTTSTSTGTVSTTTVDTSGDGSQTTATDSSGDLCGNGEVDPGEACDDGVNSGEYGGCATDCSALGPYCGDGTSQPDSDETCDDGEDNGTPECNTFCQIPGTLLTTFFVADPSPLAFNGIRATAWNGRMAAVFGGSRPLVWEIDPEAVESIRLRATEQIINPIAGALGLANGNLLVAGGSVDKLAYQLDEDLLETWTYVNPSSAPYQGFVGIAAMSGGAVLSANHVSYSAENRYSAFWTIGLATSGASLWDAIEIIEDDDDVYPRDLRALSGDRSVLLSDSAEDNPQFIIYDAVGGEVDNEELPQLTTGVHRILCAGPNGFLLMGSQATLIGFDSAGEPTFSTVYERESTPAEIGAGCSARSDNSPVVATVSAEESQATLEVIGFVGATQAWNTPVAVDALPQTAPEVYIEESLARAWVFIGGTSAVDERIVFAAVLAL